MFRYFDQPVSNQRRPKPPREAPYTGKRCRCSKPLRSYSVFGVCEDCWVDLHFREWLFNAGAVRCSRVAV
jgi:hypothetical protein